MDQEPDSGETSHKLSYKNASKNADEMRRRRVEGQVQLRKNKRDEILQKKRSMQNVEADLSILEGENLDEMEPMAIETIKQFVNHEDPKVRLKVVQSARKLLSVTKKPPIDELIEGGILPSLVDCLQSPDSSLQFEAAWALTNIASGNSQQTAMVVSSGAVKHFLNLLSSPHPNVCEQCVWALGNIIGDGPRFRDYLIEQGVIPPLLRLLEQNLPTGFLRNITWVLVNLCRNKDPPPPPEAIRQLLPALLFLIKKPDNNIMVDTVWALSYLSDGGATQIDMVIEAEIVPHLVPLLSHSHFKAQTAALRALGNIVTGNDNQTQKVLDAGALSHFPSLLRHSREKMHKEAVWFLSNIAAGNQSQIQELIDQDLVPLIVEHLDKSAYVVQKEAAWAISNMIINGSCEQLRYLIRQNIVLPMCRMLTIKDVQIVQIVLDGLLNLLRNSNEFREMVVRQIEECGGLDSIEDLQRHKNAEIYSFAYNIISSFFSEDEVTIIEISPMVKGGPHEWSFGWMVPSYPKSARCLSERFAFTDGPPLLRCDGIVLDQQVLMSQDSLSVMADHGTDIVRFDPNEGAGGDNAGEIPMPREFDFQTMEQQQQQTQDTSQQQQHQQYEF
ncbi:Importin subunit alpha-4 [Cichlidogyrus casuarinus]|uniref:Importin subunit alpha-4 n=1 Tax=Cichlidogyrus casuarinus TaxID=1844966 RepID=A0ABD2QJB9_9PLAT